MRSQDEQAKGFTLLELSVVLFIMAIILGFSLPSFSNYLESDLEKETQRMAKIITDLRLQAILNNETYKLTFDTKKSNLSVSVLNQTDGTYSPHPKVSKPIVLTPPVEFARITIDVENAVQSKFGVEKLKFDKIFGKQYDFRIDSSGFIDLFAIEFRDTQNTISLTVRNIMGDISISQEIPL
jgi:prepilin-type N-terminal cleavage/methylation domain-containing protein